MAAQQLKNIFLSASVPLEERHPKYYDTADIIAIRDAVIALTQVVLPHHRLIWGGHPSITPLINYVMEKFELNIQAHVTLYQTLFFEKLFPADNNKFENIIFTENFNDPNLSVANMRKRIFSENDFAAGVFIGGMDGIDIEFDLLRDYHPKALLFPVASTGAAARIVYNEKLPEEMKNERLTRDYGYMSLFQELLIEKI